MTIIAVKDGVMAADSLTVRGDVRAGTIQKWRAVAPEHGGGFVAACGRIGMTDAALDGFARNGGEPRSDEHTEYLHLRADGTLWKSDYGPWFPVVPPVSAIGSGCDVALGAMAAGASAAEAARVACDICVSCGGAISVLTVRPAVAVAAA